MLSFLVAPLVEGIDISGHIHSEYVVCSCFNLFILLSFSTSTQSVGILSYTFLRKTGQDDVTVPMVKSSAFVDFVSLLK